MMDNNKARISGEEVLTKLKDDGDFDKLRLKIIRTLKDDAELRDNIISMVKQSAVLNRPGAETMKPRQLSDAIHEEIGDKVMSKISDGVWQIIRSGSEMKAEIIETVQSVYNKLLDPKVNEDGESPLHSDLLLLRKRHDVNGSVSASGVDVREPEGEPNEPPGFSLHGQGWNNKSSYENDQPGKRLRMSRPCDGKARVEPIKETTSSPDRLEPQSVYNNVQPGFHEVIEQHLDGDTDDDPDVPPGFG
ncbi:uncharacterized protein LOC113781128 [Coffea eugenioides]|uniref:BOD1/SHG1 domain-containing protein n=1 Tax=Coffea arabica TaxID=13443 RepID=A0A6P6U005_COFAR|nr:uncharacterized protein LOC113781128 [Coffea eugenioides]